MSECVRNTIINAIKGNATSYIIAKDKTEVFVSANKFGKASAYRIAESMFNKANKIFNSKLFGASVSLNTTYTDGTAINIHPTQKLIESYNVKGNSISINKLVSNNDLNLFNKEKENSIEGRDIQPMNNEGDIISPNDVISSNINKQNNNQEEDLPYQKVSSLNESKNNQENINQQDELGYIDEQNDDTKDFIDQKDVSLLSEEDIKINNKIDELLNNGDIIQYCQ